MKRAIIDHAMYPLQEGNHPTFTNLVDSRNGLYLKQLRKDGVITGSIHNPKYEKNNKKMDEKESLDFFGISESLKPNKISVKKDALYPEL